MVFFQSMSFFRTTSMGSYNSRLYYQSLTFIATWLSFPIAWENIVSTFHSISGRRIDNLKQIYCEGEMHSNLGRTLTFLRLANELQLSQKEWDELIEYISA